MSELSIRVETIALTSSPTTSSGQIGTPNTQGSARSGSDPLSTPQRAAKIGDSVPIVFGRRVDGAGGVLVSPPATEARFENDATNAVTAYYLLVISEGQIDPIQVRDIFQQSCRVGTFTVAYDRRAGDWGPGNFIAPQTGFEDQVPDCPIYCGTGTGSYAGMTTGSFINTIPNGFTQWDRQVHIFSRGGMYVDRLIEGTEGSSRNVADLVLWLMRRSSRVPDGLIDMPALEESAVFTNANGLWCNILINEPSNLADWLAGNLGYFLLRESRRGGKKGLRPLLPTNADGTINTGPIGWVYTFTEDDILPGTAEITYSSRVERQPFCAQVIWRQQPEDGLGLARTATIRYDGSALDGPFEQHDLSAFATTEGHAFKVGAYILARRRYIDHRLAITLRPGAFSATLSPGDIVRVRWRRVASVGEDTQHDYLYEVDRVRPAVTGEKTLELTHFPVDEDGASLVALDVASAVGNGLLLPTGRAAVECDVNDPDDDGFTVDPGPWGDWEIGIDDPPIGGGFDAGDGWGPGGQEFENPDFGGWSGGIGAGGGDAYTAAVSFSAPLITYPDVWYGIITEDGFVSVELDVMVTNTPRRVALQLTISDGSVAAWDPESGEFGNVNAFTVTIPPGQKKARVRFGAKGDSPFVTTNRELRITDWAGGGYQLGPSPAPGDVALDVSATQAFTVEPYVGTVSMLEPGLWIRDGSSWTWAGPSTGDWTWSVANQRWEWGGGSASWSWDLANQRWSYVGTVPTGWEWLAANQRWGRTTSATDPGTRPAGPPAQIPSAVPASVPSGAGFYTVVAQATVDRPAVPNVAEDLKLDLIDYLTAEGSTVPLSPVSVGTLTIPAVPRLFGNWEWNPATANWTRRGMESFPAWRWHSSEQQWIYVGALPLDAAGDPVVAWTWNTEQARWAATEGDWTYNGTAWVGGTGSPPTASPPATTPPTQGGSTFPPDAERWLLTAGVWTAPGSEAYKHQGVPPVFDGLLIGRLTYHLLLP